MLEARPGGPAEGVAARLGGTHPVLAFLAVLLCGYGLLVLGSVALGLLVTRVLLSVGGVSSADEGAVDWLVARRSPGVVDASWVGSTLAGGLVIPAVIGSILLVCVAFRRWRIAAFVLFAVAVESATYRATTLVVHRDRPDVKRLESLPVDASFPSGHTAASIALFCGIALLLTSRIESALARVAIWAVALAIPPFVGVSRMIRGMHHPLDVASGALIGIGAIVVVLFAARVAGAAAARRDRNRNTSEEPA